MCTVCGCGTTTVSASQDLPNTQGNARDQEHGHHLHAHDHQHFNDDGHHHPHGHAHHHHHYGRDDADASHDHPHGGVETIDFSGALGGVHAVEIPADRIIRIERDILSKNNAHAAQNRARFARHRVFALNFVSSPGSGKTALLARTIEDLKARFPISVIEGDQQTANDAQRIRATGAPAIQINTGKGCHLDAHMVGIALERLELAAGGLLFIENVGNLVCPAAFDLGEAHKIVVLSVTEGEDKPLKYPDMFAAADLMLLNKSDLLAHVDFDVGQCLANALKVNSNLQTLVVSARSGEGMAAFYTWIEARAAFAAAQAERDIEAQRG